MNSLKTKYFKGVRVPRPRQNYITNAYNNKLQDYLRRTIYFDVNDLMSANAFTSREISLIAIELLF